ncbi:restriction endonuclease subunit S [Thiothrix unzii]|jgi:type I restriction enzyme S subunit|uniref:restriction endonuclease subunit S n=1 Tax=Thiothrix unzii TaxID=111769 RepID=UPI002A36EC94|nr:restriction endonuclease subunit S [Thiothrix unzii]MDX9988712.1 restriction endonuclease subunit S [Thiothrix unzii]
MGARYQPYPEYKDSGIEWLGKIPENWGLLKIKHIASLKSGDSISSDAIIEDGEYPVYGGNGFRGFTSGYTHEGNFPLIGRQGALCGNINYAKGKFWASEHAVVASLRDDINFFWFGELLRSMNLGQYSISAAQPGLAVDNIANLAIPLPPKNQQNQISNFLDHETAKIDTLIDKQQQLIKLLKEKRQAVISHAVTKGLNPDVPMKDSGVEWLGEVPEHWDITEIRFVTKQLGGGTPSKEKPSYWDGDIPWVSPKDMKVDYINDSQDKITEQAVKESSTKMIPKGSVLIVVRGMILLHSVPVALTEREVTINQDMKALIPHNNLDSEFLLFLLKGRRDFILDLVESAAHGTQRLSTETFERMKIALPPNDEQKLILFRMKQTLQKLNALNDKAEIQIGLLQERRAALISAAVIGKIDVRGWQVEQRPSPQPLSQR